MLGAAGRAVKVVCFLSLCAGLVCCLKSFMIQPPGAADEAQAKCREMADSEADSAPAAF
jgi:hypothetical protein